MTFDFDKPVMRRGTCSYKWDSDHMADDVIPMWVADMNFATVPTITEALAERIKTPAYGYFLTRDEYYDAIINWQRDRNGTEGITREMLYDFLYGVE